MARRLGAALHASTSHASAPSASQKVRILGPTASHSIICAVTQMAACVSWRGSVACMLSSGWSRGGPKVLARPLRVHAAPGTLTRRLQYRTRRRSRSGHGRVRVDQREWECPDGLVWVTARLRPRGKCSWVRLRLAALKSTGAIQALPADPPDTLNSLSPVLVAVRRLLTMVGSRAGAHDLRQTGQLHLRSVPGERKAEELLAGPEVDQGDVQRREGLDDQHRDRHGVHGRMGWPCWKVATQRLG